MKTAISLLAVLLLMGSFRLADEFDQITNGFKNSNANALSATFDNTVDISMETRSGSYSRSQATLVMSDFFSLHQVKRFEIIHKTIYPSSSYFVATMITRNGTYRTTVYMKMTGDRLKIQEIRMDAN